MTRIQFKLVNSLNFLKILIQIKRKETKMLRIFNRKITYKLKTFESQINQNQTPHAQATHNDYANRTQTTFTVWLRLMSTIWTLIH